MEPIAASTTEALDAESRIGQVRELFAQAQSELAQVGFSNQDLDNLMREAEAQAKAAAAEDNSDTPPPMASAGAGPINHPRGRRHRR